MTIALHKTIMPLCLLSLILSLSACHVPFIIAEQKGLKGKTGEGIVGQAIWMEDKCQAILTWASRFEEEYPSLRLRHQYDLHQDKTANLYRAAFFEPRPRPFPG